ncbi:MAG: hypothetical protein KatS3mg073_0376 [Meiothermus sp.]|nr:MAG: hypothetical protein KatS3mg073_0376 [Meiothermus sp.]
MQKSLRKLLIIIQLVWGLAGSFTLAAGLIWLTRQFPQPMGIALTAMGLFQILSAFHIPGLKVLTADLELAPFRTRLLLFFAILAMLAAVVFNWTALKLT